MQALLFLTAMALGGFLTAMALGGALLPSWKRSLVARLCAATLLCDGLGLWLLEVIHEGLSPLAFIALSTGVLFAGVGAQISTLIWRR